MESQLFKLVGPQLIEMGHKVSSSNGYPMGGFEGIMSVPDPTAPMDVPLPTFIAHFRSRVFIGLVRISEKMERLLDISEDPHQRWTSLRLTRLSWQGPAMADGKSGWWPNQKSASLS